MGLAGKVSSWCLFDVDSLIDGHLKEAPVLSELQPRLDRLNERGPEEKG